jgi:hypothetical protein
MRKRAQRDHRKGRCIFVTNDKGPAAMIGRLFLGFAVSLALVAPAMAELAMTGAPATMRAGPTRKAAVVQRIPANAEIEVETCRGHCRSGWRRASWRGRFGYIPAEAIVLGPPPATLPGDEMPPPFVSVQPTFVTPPVWRWTGAYVGGSWGFGSSPW